MIKTKSKGSLIVISGPSGAGKDSIIKELLKLNHDIWLSVSCISRQLRGEEKNGVDYFFLTREQFEEKINKEELLEYAEYNGNYYGTPKDKIKEHLEQGQDVILEIEVQGALIIKNKISEAIFIFIMPPSMKELKRRLMKRGTDDEEKILKRFKIAYNEINEVTKYNYVVVNDDLQVAAQKINAILMSEKCRVDRIEEVNLQNDEEQIHEEIIDKDFINEDIEI